MNIRSSLLLLTMLIGTSVASAATVQVTGVATGDGDEALFGTNIVQTGANGEILTLDINDFFTEDSGPGISLPATALDTVTMTLTAPENYLITSILYVENGTAETSADSVAGVNGAITVGGIPVNFNPEVIGPNSGGEVTWEIMPIPLALAGGVDSVTVTITNSLSALAFEPDASARIEKTDAVLTLGLTPTAIPIPAAVWLFGSGLLGLIGVARRKKTA
jgi:hypothetical protein